MASEKVTQILDTLDTMTLLEFNELKEAFKDKYNVSAAVPMPMGGGGGGTGGGDGAAVEVEVQTEFTVVLKDAGAQKIQVIKAVREVVEGLGLKEAKDLVDSAPANVKEGITQDEANKIKERLEAAGAGVDIK